MRFAPPVFAEDWMDAACEKGEMQSF